MAELKTKENNSSVLKFLNLIKNEKKKKDSLELLKIFKKATKSDPKMWGDSIIGFGKYHYKSSRSSQEGDWFLVGFSPRKQALTLYIMTGVKNHSKLLKKLGKYKLSGGSCVYINKLEDIDLVILRELIEESYNKAQEKYL